ncbi:MAG: RNA 2',3'-cyclic phosphodiesterase [Phycisphaerae bacterium]
MRTFIAIELADTQRAWLARICGEHADRTREIRWTPPERMHITLAFLGDVAPAQFDDACAIAGDACRRLPPFDLRLANFGVFPDHRKPRVLWCGVACNPETPHRWVDAVRRPLQHIGIAMDERDLVPHVTLARAKSPAAQRALRQIFLKLWESPTVCDADGVAVPIAPALCDAPAHHVPELVVFESKLLPNGPRYTSRARIPLGG